MLSKPAENLISRGVRAGGRPWGREYSALRPQPPPPAQGVCDPLAPPAPKPASPATTAAGPVPDLAGRGTRETPAGSPGPRAVGLYLAPPPRAGDVAPAGTPAPSPRGGRGRRDAGHVGPAGTSRLPTAPPPRPNTCRWDAQT